jgi:hypothetical protein
MHPWFGKFVIGGVGSAVLGASLLGVSATNVFAANGPANDKHADRQAVVRAVFESEADVLGIKPEDLRAALKSGKTVEQLAAAKGLSKDQFADRLATAVKPALDKLVDSKQITQAQEDGVLKRIRAGHIPFWDGRHHKKAAA